MTRQPKPRPDEKAASREAQKRQWRQFFHDMRLFGEREEKADHRVFLALFGVKGEGK